MGRHRLGLLLFMGAGALAACGRAPTSGEAAQTPIAVPVEAQRAPGLWEQRVVADDGAQVMRICLDAGAEAKLADFGRQLNAKRCSRHAVAQAPDGAWRFSTTCDMGEAGVVTTDGSATGDFTHHYRIQAQSTVAGAKPAALDGQHRMVVELSWKGPCPADLKPGDLVAPDGRHLKALDLIAAADVR